MGFAGVHVRHSANCDRNGARDHATLRRRGPLA